MILLIIGIICLVVAVCCYFYLLWKAPNHKTEIAILLLWLTMGIGLVLIVDYSERLGYNTSEYEFRTEIKTSTLNGIETSRDTIYIFTPKNSKK